MNRTLLSFPPRLYIRMCLWTNWAFRLNPHQCHRLLLCPPSSLQPLKTHLGGGPQVHCACSERGRGKSTWHEPHQSKNRPKVTMAAQRAREDRKSSNHAWEYCLKCVFVAYLQMSMDPFSGRWTNQRTQCWQSKGSCNSDVGRCCRQHTKCLFTGFKYRQRLVTAG